MSRSRRAIMSLVTVVALAVVTIVFGPVASVAADQGKIVINVWLANFPFPNYLDSRIQDAANFNKAHPQYDVEIKAVDFSSLPQEVNTAVQQGDAPQIADYYYNATQLARDAKALDGRPLFTSVQRAIGDRRSILGEPVVLNDILAPDKDYYTYHGDLTSMPATVNTQLLYANQSLLDKAGITTLPRTLSQLAQDCTAIRKIPGGPSNCIVFPNHSWFFQQAITQQGGLFSNHGNGREARSTSVDFDSPQVLNYVRWWDQEAKNGDYLYTSGAPNDFQFTFEAFAGQQAAFFLSTADQATGLAQLGQSSGFNVTAGALPTAGDGPSQGNIISGDSLWLAAGLSRPTQDGALAFMQYLNNTTNAVSWYKASNYMPMTNSAVRALRASGEFTANPALPIALRQMTEENRWPSSNGALLGDFDGIQNTLTDAMNDVLVNGADPAARFHQATTEANALLSQYDANCTHGGPLATYCLTVGAFG